MAKPNACIRGVPPERPLPRSPLPRRRLQCSPLLPRRRLPHFPTALRQIPHSPISHRPSPNCQLPLLLPHNQLPRLPHMPRCQRPHSRLQSPQLCKLLRLLCHNLLKSTVTRRHRPISAANSVVKLAESSRCSFMFFSFLSFTLGMNDLCHTLGADEAMMREWH